MNPRSTLKTNEAVSRSSVQVLFSLFLLASFVVAFLPGQSAAAAAGACEAHFTASPRASADTLEKQYDEHHEKLEEIFKQAKAEMEEPFGNPEFRRKTTMVVEAFLATTVKHLSGLGVATRIITVMEEGKPRPEPAIEILPEGPAHLNRIARRMRDHLGIKLIFDPYQHWFLYSYGAFNPGHSINTSVLSIQTGKADHTLKHEVRHAIHKSTLDHGQNSPFLAFVYAKENQPLPGFKKDEVYSNSFIFGEIHTHAGDLLSWAREARRTGRAQELLLQPTLTRKIALMNKFNYAVETLLNEFGALKEKPLNQARLFNVNASISKADPSSSYVNFNAYLDGKLFALEMRPHERRPDLLTAKFRLRGGELEFTLPHKFSADEGFIKETVLPSVIELVHQLNAAQKDISPRITAIEEAVAHRDFTKFKARTWELRDYLRGLYAGKATR